MLTPRSTLVLCLAASIAACAPEMPGTDAGAGLDAPGDGAQADGGDPGCAAACDDGVFCNGAERCDPADPDADARGCVAGGGSPCAIAQVCDESADRCETPCDTTGDADGDGVRAMECGGLDCDDADPNRYPGGTEVCDAGDHDEDCDPTTFGRRDIDGDDEIDAECCNVDDAGEARCGTDCDDTRAGVNPAAPEVCNARDDDCDEATDEGVLVTYYADADGDGFGTSDPTVAPTMACAPPAMHSIYATDCDDAVGAVHPGAVDECDAAMLDEDCSGTPNDRPGGCSCEDGGDPRPCEGASGLCASGTETCIGGTWSACSISAVPEECNGLDDDCNGAVDNGVRVTCYVDADNDGYSGAGAVASEQCPVGGRPSVGGCPVNYTNRAPLGANEDCDDAESGTSPAALEVCNMRDDDCDSMIDDGVGVVCHVDGDRDGYATMGSPGMMLCPVAGGCPAGHTDRTPAGATSSDCNDAIATTYPGALESCDGVDNDCSGMADDGMRVTCWNDGDDDGYAPSGAASMTYCPDGARVAVGGCPANRTNRDPAVMAQVDCNDTNRDIHPGAVELCDGIDNDCSGADDAMRVTCWNDVDNDGYARTGATMSMDCPDPTRTAVGFCPSNRTNRDPGIAGQTDCDDTNPGFSPAVVEMCTVPAVDQNCNGNADEGIINCWRDADGDRFAPTGATMVAPTCTTMTGGYGGCGTGYTSRDPSIAGNRDCQDTGSGAAARNPLATETCNGIDDNCNGITDDSPVLATRMHYRDLDGDGYGAGPLVAVMQPECETAPPSGYSSNASDCYDQSGSVSPSVTAWSRTPYYRCGDPRQRACSSGGTWFCQPLGSTSGCSPAHGGATASFDFDCNGTLERRPTGLGLACNCTSTSFCYGPDAVSWNRECYPAGTTPTCGSAVPGCACSGSTCGACGSYVPHATMTTNQSCR